MHLIQQEEPSEEFRAAWVAAGRHIQSQGTRSFKHKFLKHLNKVTKFYEGANVEIVDNGLVLNSGKPSVAKRLAK